jgi:hypothetical protein
MGNVRDRLRDIDDLIAPQNPKPVVIEVDEFHLLLPIDLLDCRRAAAPVSAAAASTGFESSRSENLDGPACILAVEPLDSPRD